MNKKVYVSSRNKNGGIYVFNIENSQLIQTQFVPVDSPMYTVINNNKLYAILRAPFDNNQNSGVISFDIDENGHLCNRKDISSTLGECGCHLYVEGNDIYVTNYISGNIIKCPDKLVQHKDENGIKEPHTHFVGTTPDNKYLLVTDLGLDKIFIYDKALNLRNSVNMNSGAGPRHLAFSDDGTICYCVNELNSTISVLEYSDGALILLDSYSTLPENYCGENAAAAIRVHNGHVFVSNRGHNSIACFKISCKTLKLVNVTSCEGEFPRDINIYENLLFSANQKDGTLTVFEIENNINLKLIQKIEIPDALCITIN